jgi:hypothetical protein
MDKNHLTEHQKKILIRERAISAAGWLLAAVISAVVFFISLSFASNI